MIIFMGKFDIMNFIPLNNLFILQVYFKIFDPKENYFQVMFISFKMNDSIHFTASFCIQVSIKQENIDSVFAQINFFGPTSKRLIYTQGSNF